MNYCRTLECVAYRHIDRDTATDCACRATRGQGFDFPRKRPLLEGVVEKYLKRQPLNIKKALKRHQIPLESAVAALTSFGLRV